MLESTGIFYNTFLILILRIIFHFIVALSGLLFSAVTPMFGGSFKSLLSVIFFEATSFLSYKLANDFVARKFVYKTDTMEMKSRRRVEILIFNLLIYSLFVLFIAFTLMVLKLISFAVFGAFLARVYGLVIGLVFLIFGLLFLYIGIFVVRRRTKGELPGAIIYLVVGSGILLLSLVALIGSIISALKLIYF